MNRRNFIQQTTAASLLTAIGGLTLPSFTTKKKKQITILHTNDTHSHIEPFEQSHYKYANKGGIARRASAIQAIRKENPNTLLLDAGDIFQGTPYFNYFGGELEFKLMSMLKYDLATLGNHDFDNSIDGFYKQLPNAKFDFVSANYNFKNTILDDIVKPYKIFIKDGIKIGVFGLGVQLDGLVDPKMYKETKYLDPIEISQDMSRILKEDKQCDLIICLSHLGYFYKQHPTKISDLNLAQKTNNIDLIIGGHTHTFLPKPTIVKNIDDKNLLVNQVGAYGINLGRVDFYFDEYDNKSAKGTTILL
ncbi:bifunctional metallophosphatase/5'-nucleotidase [Tenacibaculum maritimum]|uniref:5'-nucleotidase n=1 Tax=Tenacibaculum maritimum NCIMB 2154 TaxID=1349785 RepID=A0A2H1EA81_9FLAO|nr:metallophosphatase [Tenacibaculum maritimum]MCD9561791.1 metallophosphatase [Tenacibaculum maritimum]MCD9565227.1 metallophosphatase [Tenacibaculum maritimum]MCD9578627.1 metallophosphatase [Tenacibaculum maritimum]MCD9581018.1 metallophosphatase [Tenacibaculum maritimum]MCD9596471.1 metallophosphatase [Tenacibaculum maritimum]